MAIPKRIDLQTRHSGILGVYIEIFTYSYVTINSILLRSPSNIHLQVLFPLQ